MFVVTMETYKRIGLLMLSVSLMLHEEQWAPSIHLLMLAGCMKVHATSSLHYSLHWHGKSRLFSLRNTFRLEFLEIKSFFACIQWNSLIPAYFIPGKYLKLNYSHSRPRPIALLAVWERGPPTTAECLSTRANSILNWREQDFYPSQKWKPD